MARTDRPDASATATATATATASASASTTMKDPYETAAMDSLNIDDLFGGDLLDFDADMEDLAEPDMMLDYSDMDEYTPGPPPVPNSARTRRGSGIGAGLNQELQLEQRKEPTLPVPAPIPARAPAPPANKKNGKRKKKITAPPPNNEEAYAAPINTTVKSKRKRTKTASFEPDTNAIGRYATTQHDDSDEYLPLSHLKPAPAASPNRSRKKKAGMRPLPTQRRKLLPPLPIATNDNDNMEGIMLESAAAALADAVNNRSNSIIPASNRTILPANNRSKSSMPPNNGKKKNGAMDSSMPLPVHLPVPRPVSMPIPSREDDAFYPFSNAPINPVEPFNTMYPNLYRIFSGSSSEGPNISFHPNGNRNPLMFLVFKFVGTRIEIGLDELKNNDVHIGIDKASIGVSKSFLAGMETHSVVAELRCLLAKMKHQSKFLTKQMCHLSSWCKDNFEPPPSNGNLHETSSADNGVKQGGFTAAASELALSIGVKEDVIDGFINPPNPLVLDLKVKIQCAGFKRPDTQPLHALMTPGPDLTSSLFACGLPTFPEIVKAPEPRAKSPDKERKKRKDRTPAPAPSAAVDKVVKKTTVAVVEKELSYDKMNPLEKREVIKQIISERASALTQTVLQADSKRHHDTNKHHRELSDIVEKHKDREMETDQFWEMVQTFSYWENKSKTEIEQELAPIWQPELARREMHWREPPTPSISKAENDSSLFNNKSSLFNRLQSLLVEEDNGDDADDDENDDDSDDEDSVSLVGIDDSGNNSADTGLMDLSSLSRDQRAYIHLRWSHLIDQSLLPSLLPTVSEEEASASKIAKVQPPVDNSIDTIIRKMQMELSNEHQQNNTTVAHLKSLALQETSNARREAIEQDEAIRALATTLHKPSSKEKKRYQQTASTTSDEWVPS